MKSLKVPIPHGVVFLYDPSMIIDVPENTGTAPILYTSNCISIWTINEDDGMVSLEINGNRVPESLYLVYDGLLDTNGCELAINDSAGNSIISSSTQSNITRVRVFTNHKKYPSEVCVLIGS